MKTIREIHLANVGKMSDKWESYLPFYDALFSGLRTAPLSLLEIGVQNGGSLQTWASYFENATHIVGCDINPKCASLVYDDPRIAVVVADANSDHAVAQIRQRSSLYDVVIDDGSHLSADIIRSFLIYFRLLKPGGIYVVEDTHTLYMDAYGGGIVNEWTPYAFFKRLIDVLSYEFWASEVQLGVYMRTFFPQRLVPDFIAEGWVQSLEFRNSLIVIRKAEVPGHEKRGRRLITGTQNPVEDWGGTRPA